MNESKYAKTHPITLALKSAERHPLLKALIGVHPVGPPVDPCTAYKQWLGNLDINVQKNPNMAKAVKGTAASMCNLFTKFDKASNNMPGFTKFIARAGVPNEIVASFGQYLSAQQSNEAVIIRDDPEGFIEATTSKHFYSCLSPDSSSIRHDLIKNGTGVVPAYILGTDGQAVARTMVMVYEGPNKEEVLLTLNRNYGAPDKTAKIKEIVERLSSKYVRMYYDGYEYPRKTGGIAFKAKGVPVSYYDAKQSVRVPEEGLKKCA